MKRITCYLTMKAALVALLLCCPALLPAQNLDVISPSADGRGYFEPLEEVVLTGASGATVKVFDGKGIAYFSAPAAATVRFCVAGSLGRQRVATYDAKGNEIAAKEFTVDAKTNIDDGGRYKDMFDLFYKGMCVYSKDGVEEVSFKGKTYHDFVTWGLDHYHTMKGMQYFSPIGYEYLDLMRDYQRNDGLIWSFIQSGNHAYYESAYGPFGYFGPFDDKMYLARQPSENHCEYIYVNSVYAVWKASGNLEWMKKSLPSCAKALDYSVTSKDRYSEKYGLLKRVYTIDSWDFQVDDKYTPNLGLSNSMLVDAQKSKFGVFYGDNTGYADACDQLSEMFQRVGEKANADKYAQRAEEIRERLNKLSWNGRFFTHFVEEDAAVVRDLGVDEKTQISHSNTYSINRGFSHEQNKAIIETYIDLKNHLPKGSPGEWYAIYPPFERGFGGHNSKWQYMNGGIAGHAAGELARGAYENGYEAYATDVLIRLQALGHKAADRIWFAYTGAYPDPAVPNYTTIDLKPFADMDITTGSRGKGLNWMRSNDVGNDIANLPTGNQTFDGKRFYVVDPATNNYRSVVAISGAAGCKKQVEIPVNKTAACIYLLNCGEPKNPENICAGVTVVYDDGSKATSYLTRGKHFSSWWYPRTSNPYAGVAWHGPNGKTGDVGVCWSAIDNPSPEKKIKSLLFDSMADNSLYILLGITLSDQPHYVKPSIESFGGPDNWAAGTAMFALIEGLAGAQDKDVAFKAPLLAPRWTSTTAGKVAATVRYAASDGYVAYQYEYVPKEHKMVFEVTGNAPSMDFHVLLPKGVDEVKTVTSNGETVPYNISSIEKSKYVDFSSAIKGVQTVEIYLN